MRILKNEIYIVFTLHTFWNECWCCCRCTFNPNKRDEFSKLFNARGEGEPSSTLKSAVLVIFLHSKQQKTFQGTQGTQDLTSLGSKTCFGPSMD